MQAHPFFALASLCMNVREITLSYIVVTRLLGGATAMMTIRFWNRETYVRSAIHICVTCHDRTLPLRLGGNVNNPILVFPMISRTSVVIPQQVSYKLFITVLTVNGHKPTLIRSLWLSHRAGVLRLKPRWVEVMVLTGQRWSFTICSRNMYVAASASLSGWNNVWVW